MASEVKLDSLESAESWLISEDTLDAMLEVIQKRCGLLVNALCAVDVTRNLAASKLDRAAKPRPSLMPEARSDNAVYKFTGDFWLTVR